MVRAPFRAPLFLLVAAAAVVVAAVIAVSAAVVASAAQEVQAAAVAYQEYQDDNPPDVAAAPTVVVTHDFCLPIEIQRFPAHPMLFLSGKNVPFFTASAEHPPEPSWRRFFRPSA